MSPDRVDGTRSNRAIRRSKREKDFHIMATDISDALRSEEGKRKGGHTRSVHESGWGRMDAATAKNVPEGEKACNTAIGSHGPAPAKPLQPGASEGNPHGLKSAGAPRARVAVQPAGMKGRR
jgi:hypothetical protein